MTINFACRHCGAKGVDGGEQVRHPVSDCYYSDWECSYRLWVDACTTLRPQEDRIGDRADLVLERDQLRARVADLEAAAIESRPGEGAMEEAGNLSLEGMINVWAMRGSISHKEYWAALRAYEDRLQAKGGPAIANLDGHGDEISDAG